MLTRYGRQGLARLLSMTGRAAGLYIAACCQYWYESRRYNRAVIVEFCRLNKVLYSNSDTEKVRWLL